MAKLFGYGLSLFFEGKQGTDKVAILMRGSEKIVQKKVVVIHNVCVYPQGSFLSILLKETCIPIVALPKRIPDELIVDREEATQQLFSWCEQNQVEIPDGSVVGWWAV